MASCFPLQALCCAVVGIEYPLAKVMASVPEVVIGEPETDSPVGTDSPTEVTVPVFPVLLSSAACRPLTLAIVNAPSAIDVAMLVVPLPVTTPARVMVWFPFK